MKLDIVAFHSLVEKVEIVGHHPTFETAGNANIGSMTSVVA